MNTVSNLIARTKIIRKNIHKHMYKFGGTAKIKGGYGHYLSDVWICECGKREYGEVPKERQVVVKGLLD